MEMLVEEFWKKLEGNLQLLAAQLLAGHEVHRFQIGNSRNSAFPLRAFLTILKSNDGDELSITVDIKSIKDGLLIESDVVGEEGIVIADGPSLELHGDLSSSAVQVKVDEWFASFDRLFIDRSSDVDNAIKSLG
jgi:hypothetical protein